MTLETVSILNMAELQHYVKILVQCILVSMMLF